MNNNVDVGIIVALQLELENIENAMTEKTEVKISGMKFITGKIENKNVVVALCGVGKVFAAICTQTMILGFSPKIIINVGVAGGISNNLGIGGIVIASYVVQHDMNTTALGDELGFISGINRVYLPTDPTVTSLVEKVVKESSLEYEIGTIATGDSFINTNEMRDFLAEYFNASACDMESAAVVQACYINKVPCTILRTISDAGDDNSHLDYETFAKQAADVSAKIIVEFVKDYE